MIPLSVLLSFDLTCSFSLPTSLPPSLSMFCRFLGKVLSQYISVMVREGRREREIVTSGFDYERWRKTFERHTGKDRKVQYKAVPNALLPSVRTGYTYICIT